MGTTVAVLNPSSGTLARDDKVALLRRTWGHDLVVLETAKDMDPEVWIGKVRELEPELIVAAGGDGTVRHVVDVMVREDTRFPVAHLPFGTWNAIARSLGLAGDAGKAAEQIREGSVRAFDLGRIEELDTHFLVAAAAGFSAAVLDEAPRELKSRLGPLAYFYGAVRSLDALRRPHHVRLSPDGLDPIELETGAFVFANFLHVDDLGLDIGRSIDPHDGRLTVAALTTTNLWDVAWAAVDVVAGRERRNRNVWVRDFEAVEVAFDEPCPLQVDGEELGEHESLTLRALPDAIEMVTVRE